MFSYSPWQRELPSWYPPLTTYNTLLLRLRTLGLYHNDHLDFKESMDQQRKARGKGPPIKGQVNDVCLPGIVIHCKVFDNCFTMKFQTQVKGKEPRRKRIEKNKTIIDVSPPAIEVFIMHIHQSVRM